ncbi:hypothetical protein GEMRC1_005188 [Eukaryota sp. GEM-RC1]
MDHFELTDKVISFTVDDAKNLLNAVSTFSNGSDEVGVDDVMVTEKSPYVRLCYRHVLNLAVQDGLKMVQDQIKKVKKFAVKLNTSSSVQQKLTDVIKILGIEGGFTIKTDVPIVVL